MPINADLRYCRCGALCKNTKSRCRKCHYRARWYRRKAWRCNPQLHLTQTPTEEVTLT
jgi:hypothetical protein